MEIRKFNPVFFLLMLSLFVFSGCKEKIEEFSVSVWTGEGYQEVFEQRLQEFERLNSKRLKLTYTVEEKNLGDIYLDVLDKSTKTADIFMFPDDRASQFLQNGSLLEISDSIKDVIIENGGEKSPVIETCMENNKLYAYPVMASNGFILYYNKKYFSPEDLTSFDSLLKKAGIYGKKVSYPAKSGWYLTAFFTTAGLKLNLNPQGNGNICNWNATNTKYKGVDVAKSIMKIYRNPNFTSAIDLEFIDGISCGTIIAGVEGPYQAEKIQNYWHEDMGAVKLPSINIAGDNLQMHSVAGYKLLGVSSKTENPYWAQKIARWLSNEKTQIQIFRTTGENPANIKASEMDEVKAFCTSSAMAEQSRYAHSMRINESYWDYGKALNKFLYSKESDSADLQQVLDDYVRKIEQ